MKILIVDDEPINVKLLSTLLHKKYETYSAGNGIEALEVISENRPDIILLDILMPRMDGFEALEKIRANKKYKDISILMITALTSKSDVEKALKLGADDFLKKPIDITELYTKIALQIKLKTKQQTIDQYQVYANIHESMILAQRIQQSLLPDKITFEKVFPRSFKLYMPKDIVSGDFYFVSEKRGNKFISIFDCTGHGVPGAMLSLIGYMLIDRIINKDNDYDPISVAERLRIEFVYQLSRTSDTYAASNGMDAVFCNYQQTTKLLQFVGIRRPLVVIRQDSDSLKVNGMDIKPIEVYKNYNMFIIKGDLHSLDNDSKEIPFNNNEIQLKANDRIFIFSDGLTDQFGGESEKKFSKKRLLTVLLENQDKSFEQQKLLLYNRFADWTEKNEQTDDIVFIGIKI